MSSRRDFLRLPQRRLYRRYVGQRLEARPSLAPARRARVLIYCVLPIMLVHDSGPGIVGENAIFRRWPGLARGFESRPSLTRAGLSSELPVRVTNEGKDLTYLHIRWEGRESEGLLSIGDAWERSYGDLEWRGTVPERVMPWYFLTFDGDRVNGYGVKTQPSGFCFWQRDAEG